LSNARFELMRHDVTFPLYVEVDEILQPCLSRFSDALSIRSRTDD
jgi:hypothetical protein